jgi:hypothetical protein
MTPTTESATQLQAELGELLLKSDRLDEEITAARGALDEARADLLENVGKKQTDAATVVQSRVLALEGARAVLAAQMEATEKELATARDSESRHEKLNELAEIAAHALSGLREYAALREEAGDELRKLSGRLLDQLTALSELRQKFLARARPLADLTYRSAGTGGYGRADAEQTAAASALMSALENSGVDLTAVRIPFDDSSSLIDRAYSLPSVEPFENVIAVMIQLVFEERSALRHK